MIINREEMFANYPDVLNIEQLQDALSIGRNTAYQLIKTEQIKSIRIGKSIRIPKKYLMDFVMPECYNINTAIGLPL